MMTQKAATRDSWKIKSMPEQRGRLQLDRTFSVEEYGRLRRGLVPEVMEDKWFIYLERDWLSFHRSWTGICIYRLRLELVRGTYRVAEAYVNRDPAQYQGTDDDYDRSLVMYLIDRLLLGKHVPFPIPDTLEEGVEGAVYQFHMVGHARSNEEE